MSLALKDCLKTVQQVYGNGYGFMTPAEFLDELRAVQPEFRWFLTKDGRIRGTFSEDRGNWVFDPITAVAFARTGEFFCEGAWSEAAHAIGMSLTDCADFVSACNYNWDPSSRQGSIRRDVLTAVEMPTLAACSGSFLSLRLSPDRKPGGNL